MHEVLISYSTKDKLWADAACAALEAHGIRCWIAPRDIMPGTEWGAAIIAGIDACKVMVVIFSASANESPQVRREVERAITKGLTVVPCRVEDVKPVGAMEYALGNTHWLDVFTPPVERQMNRLAESVEALLQRDRGGSRVAGRASLASDSTGQNENLRDSSISPWCRRGKHRPVAAVGVTLFVLLAASLTVVSWPRKEAASTLKNADTVGAGQTASPEKSPAAATSATPAQPLPAEPQGTKKPANDYDEIATGRWLPLMASRDDFNRVVAQKSYEGPEPKFDQGVLELSLPPRGSLPGEINFVGFPGVQAKNIIIRARVRKLSPRLRGRFYRGSNVGLALRCADNNACAALLTGRNRFVIARGKWQDLSPPHDLEGQYDADFFEFAFAAIGDKLTAYVNGRRILEAPASVPQSPGEVRVSAYSGGGLFQNIEVQVLDKPIGTLQTPPVR
jgi:TIR domain